MQTYAQMKDSGVVWLGDIPAEWQQKRAKFLFYKSQHKPHVDDDVVTAFRDGEVVLRSQRRTDGFTFADKEIGYQHVEKGDLVIHAMDAFAGAIGVSKSDGKMSPVCSICKPLDSQVDTEYFSYLLRWMTKTNWLVAIAKGIRERSTDFRYSDFGNIVLPLPSIQVQKNIVSYINEETALIDDLIAKQQRLLALLEEKRRATITHAVTDDRWPHEKIKYITKKRDKKVESANGLPYIGLEHVESFSGKRIAAEAQSEPEGLTLGYEAGDILFGKLRPYLAKVLLTADSGVCSSEFIVLKATDCLLPEFLKYSLLNEQFVELVNSSTYGAKMPRANWDFIGNANLALPPIDKQEQIVYRIKQQEELTDKLRQGIVKQIDLLKERRTSLISNAVTGKIKV